MKFKILLVLSVIVISFVGGVGVGSRHATAAPGFVPATVAAKQALYYICPMHPSVKYASPGNCPICGMRLVPVYTSDSNAQAAGGAGCCGAPESTTTSTNP